MIVADCISPTTIGVSFAFPPVSDWVHESNPVHPVTVPAGRSARRAGWQLSAVAAPLLSIALIGCSGEGEQQAQASDPIGTKRVKREHLVELADVRVDSLRASSVHTGSLRYRKMVRVFNQEEGALRELPYFEGDAVRSGQMLLKLDDALLRAELEKAGAVEREAEANLKRLRRLRASKLVAEDEYQRAATQLEVARAERSVLETRLSYTVVDAPFDGVVTARLVEIGDILPRHSHVLTLADPTSLMTELRISELLTPHLSTGDTVGVRIDALGSEVFQGRISRIHPELDAATRQGRVEVTVQPVPERARAGQFARVEFTTAAFDQLVMPFICLRLDPQGEHVFRVGDEGVAERVGIRTGRRLANRVEVLEGLRDGDRVVARGFLGLRDGLKVKAVGAEAK